jgi:hypothetical protein
MNIQIETGEAYQRIELSNNLMDNLNFVTVNMFVKEKESVCEMDVSIDELYAACKAFIEHREQSMKRDVLL